MLHNAAITATEALARQIGAEFDDPAVLIAAHLPRPLPRDGDPVENIDPLLLAIQLSARHPLALDRRVGGGAHGAARGEQQGAVALAFRQLGPELGGGFRPLGEGHLDGVGLEEIEGPPEVPIVQRFVQRFHLRRLRAQVLGDRRGRETFLLQQFEWLACLDGWKLAGVAGEDQPRDVHAVRQLYQLGEPLVADLRGLVDHDDRTGERGPGLRHLLRASGAIEHALEPAKEAVDRRGGHVELGTEVTGGPSGVGQGEHALAILLQQSGHRHQCRRFADACTSLNQLHPVKRLQNIDPGLLLARIEPPQTKVPRGLLEVGA